MADQIATHTGNTFTDRFEMVVISMLTILIPPDFTGSQLIAYWYLPVFIYRSFLVDSTDLDRCRETLDCKGTSHLRCDTRQHRFSSRKRSNQAIKSSDQIKHRRFRTFFLLLVLSVSYRYTYAANDIRCFIGTCAKPNPTTSPSSHSCVYLDNTPLHSDFKTTSSKVSPQQTWVGATWRP